MRILLAVDGSWSADRARDLVAALPWREGGRVRIVSVGPPDAEGLEDDIKRHRDAIEAAEREIRSTRSDLVIEPILATGRPASVIVEEARDMPADLIVVGHRGHGAWESMLLGSVSAEIVDHAPCPVLVARDERLGPIVFADDGSPSARAGEALLTDWPFFNGLPITVLTVTDDGEGDTSAAERLRSAGFDVDSQTRTGDPALQIVALARKRMAGLIVVGTRGQTGLQRLILGSVARNVLLHAPCSVLVVREHALMARSTVVGDAEGELVSAFG